MVTASQIQSIVDGECSHEARASLLREIEQQPSGWRTLALALLEEQQWSKELKGASLELVHSTPTIDSEHDKTDVVRLKTAIGDSEQSKPNSTSWLSMLAASLLLGVGMYGGSLIPKWTSESGQTPVAETRPSSNSLSSPLLVPQESDLKMLVSGPNKETSEIPIYDLNSSERELLFAREMVELARINQRLRREGYELEVQPEYYTGKLNDGRSLVVPVKHIGVRPYGL